MHTETAMKLKDLIWGVIAGGVLLAAGFFWFQRGRSAEAPIQRHEIVPPVPRRSAVPETVDTPAASGEAGRPAPATSAAVSLAAIGPAPRDILQRLATLQVDRDNPQSIRQLLVELERLKEAGPAALPEIRAFLRAGDDTDFGSVAQGNWRGGRVPTEFVVPPSLRLGLLETVKNIGGPEAEQLLVDELRATGRGVEVAYLANALEEIAPGRYANAAVAAVHDLLSMPLSSRAPSRLDRNEREFLFGVLEASNDRSYLDQAQSQLVRPDGRIDRDALDYLEHTLGPATLDVVARAWQDSRVAAGQKEPLARAVLPHVGANAQADRLFQAAIADPALSNGQRRNLIEDLEDAGLPDRRRLTPANLPVIDSRIALIDRLAAGAQDQSNARAFAEARRDLLRLREAIVRPATKKK